MRRVRPFEEHSQRYEEWFERHPFAYRSEIEALRSVQGDEPTRGLEVGVGSARFAEPLGFRFGLEPASAMVERAVERGVLTVRGIGEQLPFRAGVFDQVLLVTTICFVDDLLQSFLEARRVLTQEGRLLVGFIDRESPIGRFYEEHRYENVFYRDAVFYTTYEVLRMLRETGYRSPDIVQTLFRPPSEMTSPSEVREGFGDGSFVALAARR